MADESSIFGQLSQLNSPGKSRDAKEVPVDKDSRRRPRGKKKKEPEGVPKEDWELEETAENGTDRKPSGKLVDIII